MAELDGIIVGFAGGGKSRDDDAIDLMGELYSIYILPNLKGQGIGSALMKEVLAFLKQQGFKKATLWVVTSNNQARDFYERKGWLVEGMVVTHNNLGFNLEEVRYIKHIE